MKDIQLENGDLKIKNGDLVIDNSEEQEIEAILSLNEGNLKNAPLIGVGLVDFINGENLAGLTSRIRTQLKADGKEVDSIQIQDGKLDIKLKQWT